MTVNNIDEVVDFLLTHGNLDDFKKITDRMRWTDDDLDKLRKKMLDQTKTVALMPEEWDHVLFHIECATGPSDYKWHGYDPEKEQNLIDKIRAQLR